MMAIATWALVIVVRVVFAVLGLVVIPFAIPRFKFTGEWRLLRLAWWALPWDNQRDGLLGDKRLHFWTVGDQFPKWMADKPYVKAYWWLAIRNPTNWLTRQGLGCDLTRHSIERLAEGEGWWFNRAGKYWYAFELKRGGFEFFIGFKVLSKYIGRDWSEDPSKAVKGFTARIAWQRQAKT